jgi:ssRNA-specific RNase YbeY (16S rRNA maturation enzyme)
MVEKNKQKQITKTDTKKRKKERNRASITINTQDKIFVTVINNNYLCSPYYTNYLSLGVIYI